MNPSDEMSHEAYNFLKISREGIWCFGLSEPLDLSWDLEKQVNYIVFHSKILEANDTFARMYGYESSKEVIGLPLKNILPIDKPQEWEHIRNFVRNQYIIQDEESLELDREGGFKYFLNSVRGVIENGKLWKIWGIQKDITDLKKNHFKLIKLHDIETLIGRLSKKFILTDVDNFDTIVNDCLRELGIFTKVDRVYIFQIFDKFLNNTYEWCAEGVEPFIESNQKIEIPNQIVKIIENLTRDNYLLGYKEERYGGLTDIEVEILELQGIESLLLVGLRSGGRLVGFVGYDAVKQKKVWKKEDVELLRIFSDMLSIVTERIEIQKELIRKEESLHDFYDRINSDLEIARITQKNIVTLDFPENNLFNVTSFFKPYDKVGGDIISYFENDDRLNVLFGDVSGHGISSAMVSGMVVLSFKNSARLKESPKVVLNHLNRDLKEIVLNHHISAVATCFCTIERKMLYSYAGHPPIALIREGKVIELGGMNTPLLTIDNIDYFESELKLIPGDRIIYFSDGCFEVFNSQDEFMGLYPFLDILEKNHTIQNSTEFIQRVIGKVVEYCSDDIRDDLTMLVLDVK